MTAAPQAGALDEGEVRRFVGILHSAATRALADYPAPGLLQLVTIPPDGGPTGNQRFPIGAVDPMAAAAIDAARAGLNVYVEGRTLAPDAPGRGDAAATRFVFAFVDDADHDKGKGGSLALQPSLAVETSPGNRHAWLFLELGIPAAEADPIGRAMRAATGSDSATAKLTQPYRVAGTPNFPDARKRARGRVVEATRILATGGPAYSPSQLVEAFPAVERAKAEAEVPKGRSGKSDATIEEMAAVMPDDGRSRSDVFFAIVARAKHLGMLPDDLEEVFRLHPGGPAEKYLEPYDRLQTELHRVWKKLGNRPTVPPHYPDRAVPVDEARAALREAVRAAISGPPAHRAIRVGTGVGKTRAAVEAVADDIRQRRAAGDRSPWLYAIPRHDLGEEIAAQFRALGVSARVDRHNCRAVALGLPPLAADPPLAAADALWAAIGAGDAGERRGCREAGARGEAPQADDDVSPAPGCAPPAAPHNAGPPQAVGPGAGQ